MVIKRKKNANLIYEPKNSKYYLDLIKAMQQYDTMQDAFRKYNEFHKLEREEEKRFFRDNRLVYELSPNQVYLLIKSIEMFKFFVDNSFFFKCEREELQDTSIDLFYLYQIIYKQFMAYVPQEMKNKIYQEYNGYDFKKYG